jgi:6-phosphogluconolactonase (cycloisomerase 2 family)
VGSRRLTWLAFGAAILACAAEPALAQASPPPLGALTQSLGGTAGCLSGDGSSEDGANTCAKVSALGGPESVTLSPDGRFVYVGSYDNNFVESSFTVFSRNASTGALTELAGKAGCLTSDGSAGKCTVARGFLQSGDGQDLVITRDGKWAYMTAQNNHGGGFTGAVLVFKRNPATGALTQLSGKSGCFTATGTSQAGPDTCRKDSALAGPSGISLSPDDKFVYVDDYNNDTIDVFSRNDTTGALNAVQCLSESGGSKPPACATARVVGDARALAITPDGRHAYSADFVNGISIFDRNPVTGLLTQKTGATGCVTDTGKDNTGASTCAAGRVLAGAYPLVVAPNGRTLYVGARTDGGVSVFRIEANGSLAQLAGTAGCVTETGQDQNHNPCALGRGLAHIYGATLSPDGRTLYGADDDNTVGAVSVFSVASVTGALTQLPGHLGCVSSDGSDNGTSGACFDGRGLLRAYQVAISPNGRSVYVAAAGLSTTYGALDVFTRETAPTCASATVKTHTGTAVTIHLACRDLDGQRVTLHVARPPAHGKLGTVNQSKQTVTYTPARKFAGSDSFSFTATDGANVSAPATAKIRVT